MYGVVPYGLVLLLVHYNLVVTCRLHRIQRIFIRIVRMV